MEDRELLRLLAKDAEAGLARALELYGGAVKTVLWRILWDYPEDAEECLNETFFRLWKNRRKLHGAPVRAWLIVTARNLGLDRLRKLLRERSAALPEPVGDALSGPAPGETEALLDALSPEDREIFVRKYYFLETAAEIAAALGRTESDVKSRLHRGRERLRRELTKGEPQYEP